VYPGAAFLSSSGAREEKKTAERPPISSSRPAEQGGTEEDPATGGKKRGSPTVGYRNVKTLSNAWKERRERAFRKNASLFSSSLADTEKWGEGTGPTLFSWGGVSWMFLQL